jgi:hypothetical protein
VSLNPAAGGARILWNAALNIALLPVYSVLFFFTSLLALTRLFPARVARENIHQRWKSDSLSAWFGTSAVLFHYILLVIEDFVLWPLGALVLRDNIESRRNLFDASTQAKRNEKGVAVLSAHFGNIEVTAQAISSCLVQQVSNDLPLMALAKPSRHPAATRLLSWYRAKRKIEVIHTNRKDLVRQLLNAWKQQRAIALLIDQKPAHAGFFTPFLGAPAAFPEGGVEIALRSKCEFVCVASRRMWPGCYTFDGLWLQNVTSNEKPLPAIVIAYAQWLEELIRQSPWQWCWDYKKWSRKPALHHHTERAPEIGNPT